MSYIDPITGGADMRVVFKKSEDAKWLHGHLSCGKIFCSRYAETIFFFTKDLRIVKYLLPDEGMEYEIKTVKYMSVEDAIDRTINKS